MKPAILVIDMLNDFFKKKNLLYKKRGYLCKHINELVAYGRLKNIPIIWVRQEYKSDLSDSFLEQKRLKIQSTIKGTAGAQILEELDYQKGEKVIVKKRYSAFHKTTLLSYLKKLNVDTLIMAGINTHACIRMAAIDAYQYDFHVIIAKQGTLSYDLVHHKVTLDYLKNSMNIPSLNNVQIKNKISRKKVKKK